MVGVRVRWLGPKEQGLGPVLGTGKHDVMEVEGVCEKSASALHERWEWEWTKDLRRGRNFVRRAERCNLELLRN